MTEAPSSSSSARLAQKQFELENNVVTLDPRTDAIFHYDNDEQVRIRNDAPWKRDPHFFQRVRISSIALIKMMIHTRAGGIYEVMGSMVGKVDVETRTIYIMDAFALPVQGTETRVNAGDEAYEFMVQWQESSQRIGRLENTIGWYHSHPGYGCWLSGIDVSTQMTNQQYLDPFVAVVIDPNRTISAGRVDIGAFRTYPEGYTPPEAGASEYQSIPLNKIEDFGVHANSYYPLKVEHFKSCLDTQLLDMLWNKYWANTLAQSPVVVNRAYAVGQIQDLGEKLSRAWQSVGKKAGTSYMQPAGGAPSTAATTAREDQGVSGAGVAGATDAGSANGIAGVDGAGSAVDAKAERIDKMINDMAKKEKDTPLAKAANDGLKISMEAHNGLVSQVLKDVLFNKSATGAPLPPSH
ncbi:COP9 signalosome complex subunit 5 [Acaromyces ingoldii]|uniref:COP9 signalosome complex subunit 5 n=1 Tax=Acaromyces ingoldii TaxID=215250 RepID=A0A316YS93_9BASI|nr:COP9 signalosome complex subunit 5 [Acaromyces ingoldii]PWN92101.1 COP9 signalosome complex subunit 5 [Acaromyces ingoldii]